MQNNRWAWVWIVLTALLATPAVAVDLSNPAFTRERGTTATPVGYYDFCRTWPSECIQRQGPDEPVVLTEAIWDELVRLNDSVNVSVRPVTDEELYHRQEYWTYPQGAGDCEDYVLQKRRELMAAGWPESDLLIAVVRKQDWEGHAVLIVRTDRGDLVLDNLVGEIRLWDETPYVYIKRQSPLDNQLWVAMEDDRQIVSASVR